MNPTQVSNEALTIRDRLKVTLDVEENPIDISLSLVPPFIGQGEIKLIIIGQDPTVRNKEQRSKISITLNLKSPGSLLRYIEDDICTGLSISLENVYATNLFKYFYTSPPADTPGVLFKHLLPNLELLKEEINMFPYVPIITLGEPVLKLLANEPQYQKVRNHWGYDKATGKSNGVFRYCPKEKNNLSRVIFPFPHQPSLRKTFYLNTLGQYISFLKKSK